jgi:hypothetical protein
MRTTILLLLLSILAPATWADDLAPGREAFRDALARVAAGQPDDPAGDSEALRTYPLYRYLEEARLSRRLRSVPSASGQGLLPVDADIGAFLVRHGEEPVSRGLRRAWLASLADRAQWEEYLEQYRPEIDDGVTRRCQALVARIRLGRTAGLAEDVAEYGTVESNPTIDGRNMVMVVAPHKNKSEVKTEQNAKRDRFSEQTRYGFGIVVT